MSKATKDAALAFTLLLAGVGWIILMGKVILDAS